MVAIICTFAALLIFTFLPLWEGRNLIIKVVGRRFGKRKEKEGSEVNQERRRSEKSVGSSVGASQWLRLRLLPGDHIVPRSQA